MRIIKRVDPTGLRAAQKAILGGGLWLRCPFVFHENALATIPQAAKKAEGTLDKQAILNLPDMHCAIEALKQKGAKAKPLAPKLAVWMESGIPESLTVKQ